MEYSSRNRRGFTVIELLVAMAVVGLLLAVLVPAVQNVRVSAKRLQCQNRLRQLVVALHNHVDVKQGYPGSRRGSPVELLPFLEQATLYEKLSDGSASSNHEIPGLPVFVCPVDPESSVAWRTTNYLFNGGTKLKLDDADGIIADNAKKLVRPGDVTDGLTYTAAISERLFSRGLHQIGLPDSEENSKRDTWFLREAIRPPLGAEDFVEVCQTQRFTPHSTDLIGAGFLGVDLPPYSHLMPPNSLGCFNAQPFHPHQDLANSYHGLTSTSLHAGGVHTAFCDGHVRFINDKLDAEVWRGAGSRNGQELIGF